MINWFDEFSPVAMPPAEVLEAAVSGARVSAVDRTAATLRGGILAGRWRPGQRLPPERTLAEEMGVSRLTLRSALLTLAGEGLVRARQGSGIEVLDHRRTGSLDLFSWILASPEMVGDAAADLFEEIYRIRRLLAVDTLVRAAERATPEHLATLEEIAALQEERLARGEIDAYLDGDADFSRAIVRAAGGVALELVFNSLEKVSVSHRHLVREFLGPLEVHVETYPLILSLLRHDRGEEVRELADAALALVEKQGLQRVRRCCRRLEREARKRAAVEPDRGARGGSRP